MLRSLYVMIFIAVEVSIPIKLDKKKLLTMIPEFSPLLGWTREVIRLNKVCPTCRAVKSA